MEAALPPGPREPAALQTLEWVARPTAFLRRCAAAYGEAFTIRLAFDDAPLVLVWHPEAVRAVYAAAQRRRKAVGRTTHSRVCSAAGSRGPGGRAASIAATLASRCCARRRADPRWDRSGRRGSGRP